MCLSVCVCVSARCVPLFVSLSLCACVFLLVRAPLYKPVDSATHSRSHVIQSLTRSRYVNYGWGKSSPSYKQDLLPLQPLEQATGYSSFNVTVPNGDFWTNGDGNWMQLLPSMSPLLLPLVCQSLDTETLFDGAGTLERMALSLRFGWRRTGWG